MSQDEYPTEVEAAFLIVSESPLDLVDRITKIQSLGGYDLLSGKDKLILDRYFDTPGFALRDSRFALRIREVDGKRFLTLKGPSMPIPGGGVERLEMEGEWSDDALKKALKALWRSNIEIGSSEEISVDQDPIASMSRHNLRVVQERSTERVIRDIIYKYDDDYQLIAEMAIDAVNYHFDDIEKAVKIYQIEIEVKGSGGPPMVSDIAAELKGEIGSEIRRWDYGKLATGKAIEELFGERKPKEIVDSEGNLRPLAVDLIEENLRKKDE